MVKGTATRCALCLLVVPRSAQKPDEPLVAYHQRLRYNEYMRLWTSRNIAAIPERRAAVAKRARDRHAARPELGRARGERHHKSHRQQLDLLKARPCADCGGRFRPECMDFDHRPGEAKRFGVGNNMRRAWVAVLAEIAKCDLVCANCHRVRTRERALGRKRKRVP